MKQDRPVDFVIVTALAEERDAVLAKLPDCQQLTPDQEDIRTYFLADLPVTFPDHSSGEYRIIVMSLLGMGRVQASVATADAIRRWHPRYLLLVGIAGGMAARHVSVGDILISDQIVDYELQKITSQGPQIRWEVQRADPRLLGAANSVRDEGWQALMKVERPGSGLPRFFIGPIASGDKVIALGEILTKYQQMWPKLIGVEMEAAGAATAAFQSADRPGFFMVRGVSDLADENKGSEVVEKWRSYACDAAAAFAIALLKSGPVPLSLKHMTKKVQLIIEGDFEAFTSDRQEDIVSVLSALLRMNPADIRVLKVQNGSIKITLELPKIAANRLYELAAGRDPRVSSLGILSIWIEGREELTLVKEKPGTGQAQPAQGTEDGLQDLSIAALSNRCAEQNALLSKRRENDPRYCYEIFRRAIQERDEQAWKAIYQNYYDLIAGWARRHPLYNALKENEDYFVNAALLKFWQAAGPDRLAHFPDIKSVLVYLKLCVHSVMVDTGRAKERSDRLEESTLAEGFLQAAVEENVSSREQSQELWTYLQSRLQNPVERQVAYNTFVLALKPIEVYIQNRDIFHEVSEVYRIKENIINRLTRDPEFRKRLGIAENRKLRISDETTQE